MAQQLNPGPINPELLHSNEQHRARYLFNGLIANDKKLTCRRCDKDFWDLVPQIPANVMYFIQQAGFGSVIRVGYRKYDYGLITALVERWRPETHTFHFPIGEATVTLQDVQVLWGLRVDGNVVTGTDNSLTKNQYLEKCQEMMGFTPYPEAINRGAIRLSCLYNELLVPLPADPSIDDIVRRARVYIMHLLGGSLFPNSSGNLVYLYHLDNLANLEQCGQLSWGSAILACLYRRLCKATKYSASDVSGPIGLLQLWAYERIRTLSPSLVNSTYNFTLPYGARYVYIKN